MRPGPTWLPAEQSTNCTLGLVFPLRSQNARRRSWPVHHIREDRTGSLTQYRTHRDPFPTGAPTAAPLTRLATDTYHEARRDQAHEIPRPTGHERHPARVGTG